PAPLCLPYGHVPSLLAATAKTAWTVLGGRSSALSVKVPLAAGAPSVPLLTPPASTTDPAEVPEITAASFDPLIVIVTVCAVPSSVSTVNVSVVLWPLLSA